MKEWCGLWERHCHNTAEPQKAHCFYLGYNGVTKGAWAF